MTEEPAHGLDEQTEARLERMLRVPGALAPSRADLTVETLVRYLADLLTEEDAAAVEAALTRCGEERDRMREVISALESARAMTWSEVAAAGAAGQRVAQQWMELLQQQASNSDAWRDSSRQGATAWLRQGGAAAAAAWNKLRQFAEQLHWELRSAGLQPALARGSANQAQLSVAGWTATVAGRATMDGDFTAVAELVPAPEEGATVWLDLVCGDLAWPVGESTVHGGRVEWTSKGLGAALGLHAESLPGNCMRIRLDREAIPIPARLSLRLAWPADMAEPAVPLPPAVLQAQPAQYGATRFLVELPAEIGAAWPNGRIVLEMAAFSGGYQTIANWRAAEALEGPLVAEAPAALTTEAPLRIRFEA